MRSRCVAQLALSSLPDTIALCVAGPPGSQSSRSRQLATSGYATFGEHVASDVLVSYPRTPLVAVARLALAVVVSASYPLMSHPARESAMSLLSATARRGALEPPASRAFRAVSAAHLAGTLAIALAVDDLGVVLAIVGATVQTTLQYVLPGLCYVRLVRGAPPLKRGLAVLQLMLGLVLMPVSLYCLLNGRR